MQKKIMAVGAITCALAGFGLGLLNIQQEAEAALLSDSPLWGSLDSFQSPNLPEPAVQEVVMAVPVEPVKLYTEADVDMLARLIYTEARGVESKTEQAAVVWCVLNRLDNPNRQESTIAEVITAPHQFDYRPWVPVTAEFWELAKDVLGRWQAEKQATAGSPVSLEEASRSKADVGRVLPAEYQYFEGDGRRNYFAAEWKSKEYWGWELPSPYGD